MRPRPDAGQASAEYVGVLALVAAVLTVAATAVAAPDLPRAVVRQLEVALCIVGGDVCRTSDARAAGLEPCVQADEVHARQDTLSFGIAGEFSTGRWTATKRSDGTWVLTAARGRGSAFGPDVGAASLGPVSVELGGTVRLGFTEGSEWVLPEARIRQLAKRMRGEVHELAGDFEAAYHGLPEPRHRFEEGGVAAEFAASASVGTPDAGAPVDLAGAGADLVLGRRLGAGGAVWYFRAAGALRTAAVDLGLPGGAVVAEHHSGSPPRLVLRATIPEGGTETEHVVTLPLRTAALRAAAARSLLGGDGGGLLDRLRADALVERRTYELDREDGGIDLEVLGFGFEREESAVRRRLTGAELLMGGRKVQRVDCLGRG